MKTAVGLYSINPQLFSIDGTREKIFAPAVVAISNDSYEGKSKQLDVGIAVLDDSGTAIRCWSPGKDCDIVQLYRALHMLAHCRKVYDDTLCACYYASGDKNAIADHYAQTLKESGIKDFPATRSKVLGINPDYASIERIVKNAKRCHIQLVANDCGVINAIAS